MRSIAVFFISMFNYINFVVYKVIENHQIARLVSLKDLKLWFVIFFIKARWSGQVFNKSK